MAPRFSLTLSIALVSTFGWASPARAADKLDAETIKAILRTTVIEDKNYTAFLVTLADQGRFPRSLIDSSLDWARKKPEHKFEYFKQSLIVRANAAGITLPNDTPPLRRDVHGRVVQRVVLVDVPVPYVPVEVEGTEIKTRTNLKGEFTLPDLPWGVFKVEVHGGAAQLFRTMSTHLSLPFLPTDKTTIRFRFH
jgi:hypothetical protein